MALHFRRARRHWFDFVFVAVSALWLPTGSPLRADGDAVPPAAKEPRFELLLKRQVFSYLPYEYTAATQRITYGQVYQPALSGPLRQNEKVLVPAALSCENCLEGFRFELSYYEIELPVPNAWLVQTTPQGATVARHYFNPVARSEALGVAAKMLPLAPAWKLYVGGGFQNVNKYIFGTNVAHGAYQEFFFTYGPAFVARVAGDLNSVLSVQAQTKVFYTIGPRSYQDVSISAQSLTTASGIAHTRGLFRGAEADISLAIRVHDRFRLYFGYDRIYSYFSYVHYHQLDVVVTNVSPGMPVVSIIYGPKAGNHEVLEGTYLGLSVLF